MQNDSERGDHVHALAREMAGPVAKGWLHPCLAYAALALAADRAARRSSPYSLAALPRAWRTLQQTIRQGGVQ